MLRLEDLFSDYLICRVFCGFICFLMLLAFVMAFISPYIVLIPALLVVDFYIVSNKDLPTFGYLDVALSVCRNE